jgi:dTDP-3-amino-3,4,6-trideoxy-alpha-D-glucose transaminase
VAVIPANDFQRQWADTQSDLTRAFERVLASGWYILGSEVQKFEERLAAYWGLSHACGVASGLDAIEIGLRILGCKPGDKVLTTPLSAFATTLAIVKLGAVPVFVDVDPYGQIDLALARPRLAHGDIRFFVPVHLYGHVLDLHELARLRDEFSLGLIEDCAQSIGAKFHGVACGSAGQIAATSFYPTKNLGAIGDGGAILTNNAALDASARRLRDYGQSAKYRHTETGYNSRLDELQAALMHDAFLPRLETWISRRRAIAQRYLERIRNPVMQCLGSPAGSESSWYLFPALVEPNRKQAFIEYLKSSGIGAGEHYPIAIPDQEAMAKTPHEVAGDLMTARRIARCEVSLPIHPYLKDEEIATVIDVCNHWAG